MLDSSKLFSHSTPFNTIFMFPGNAIELIQNEDFVVAYLAIDRQTSLALLHRIDDCKEENMEKENQRHRGNMSE